MGYVLNKHILNLQGCEAALMEEELHVLFTFFFCILSNSFKSDAKFCISIDHNFIIHYKYPFCSHSLGRVMERGKEWTLN